MLKLKSSTRFRKDYKICVKRGYDMRILNDIVDILRKPDKLPEKNKDHNLTGNLKGYRECHIMPDWLLIYEISDNELYLSRTGTHADLFNM